MAVVLEEAKLNHIYLTSTAYMEAETLEIMA